MDKLYLEVRYNSKDYSFVTRASRKVRELHHLIFEHEDIGLPVDRQRLVFMDKELTDPNATLQSYGFVDGDRIQLAEKVSIEPAAPVALLGDFATPFLATGAHFSDVDVVCQNETFKAHKLILAGRSEVFKRMLTNSSFNEAKENRIVIEKDQNGSEVEPRVVELLLKFIYEDMIPEDMSEDVAWQLLDLAKMYLLKRLVRLCMKKLCDAATVGNCCALLEAASACDEKDYFETVVQFVRENKDQVLETEGWRTMERHLLDKVFRSLL